MSKNQQGYNSWSSFYDSYPNPTVAADELSFPKHWLHLKDKNILEIGCGTGRHTQKLLANHNKVTGIDISEGMLAVAKEKLLSENLTLIHADILKYELPANQFDAAICSLVIEHISDLDLFFNKVYQCLKPQGSFYLSEIHPVRTAQGIMAHFKNPDGSETHLHSLPHTESDLESSSTKAGFVVSSKQTVLGSDELKTINPKWEKHLNLPLVQIWVFKKS